jgi:putative transposase
MSTPPDPYRGYRHPPEIISQAVWLYHCFSLSLREVELILAERGLEVSYESIRQWGLQFGEGFAKKRRRPRPGDIWHMDEMFIRINGQQHYLWRAVDQDGVVLGPSGNAGGGTSWCRAGATPRPPSAFSRSC